MMESNPNGETGPEIVETNEKRVLTAGGDAWLCVPADMTVNVEDMR